MGRVKIKTQTIRSFPSFYTVFSLIGTDEDKDIMNTDSDYTNRGIAAVSGKRARNYCELRRSTASEISFNTNTTISQGGHSVRSMPVFPTHVKGIVLQLVLVRKYNLK